MLKINDELVVLYVNYLSYILKGTDKFNSSNQTINNKHNKPFLLQDSTKLTSTWHGMYL